MPRATALRLFGGRRRRVQNAGIATARVVYGFAWSTYGRKGRHRVGVGAFVFRRVHAQGVEMLITGDASHRAALRAYELNMHLVSAGHYFTEIWGVLALGAYIQKTQGMQVLFIDNPTGH